MILTCFRVGTEQMAFMTENGLKQRMDAFSPLNILSYSGASEQLQGFSVF